MKHISFWPILIALTSCAAPSSESSCTRNSDCVNGDTCGADGTCFAPVTPTGEGDGEDNECGTTVEYDRELFLSFRSSDNTIFTIENQTNQCLWEDEESIGSDGELEFRRVNSCAGSALDRCQTPSERCELEFNITTESTDSPDNIILLVGIPDCADLIHDLTFAKEPRVFKVGDGIDIRLSTVNIDFRSIPINEQDPSIDPGVLTIKRWNPLLGEAEATLADGIVFLHHNDAPSDTMGNVSFTFTSRAL